MQIDRGAIVGVVFEASGPGWFVISFEDSTDKEF